MSWLSFSKPGSPALLPRQWILLGFHTRSRKDVRHLFSDHRLLNGNVVALGSIFFEVVQFDRFAESVPNRFPLTFSDGLMEVAATGKLPVQIFGVGLPFTE